MRIQKILIMLLLLLVVGCSRAEKPITMIHIHGLGYTGDGSQLYVPAHDGFRIYDGAAWSDPPITKHDFMGYSATNDGFFSSGHPAPGAKDLRNPVGLIRSTDGGQTLTRLGFEGESDFHVMGAGYYSHAIYVFNPQPNSRLSAGLHRTVDEGKTWQSGQMNGVEGSLLQLAVHPAEPDTVAIATDTGLFLSRDAGENFARIYGPQPVAAAHFTPEGNRILFGFQTLHSYDLRTETMTALTAPALGQQDMITFLAVNPGRLAEVAVATYKMDIFLTQDQGATWKRIAKEGTAQ